MGLPNALCEAAAALNGQEVRVLALWSITSATSVNLALEVVGQSWSSEVISLFLDDWERANWHEAATCLWTFYAKK